LGKVRLTFAAGFDIIAGMSNLMTVSKNEIKRAVQEGVREAFGNEMARMRALLLPYVSEREQADLVRRYKKPSRRYAKSSTFTV
jgi:hypothetical protein